MAAIREHANDDRWLVGPAIQAYQEQHGLSEVEVAHRLGLTVERLGWLLMRTRPRPDAPTFLYDTGRLARAFSCDADLLAEILATV
jgi:hypothetical protein